MTLVLRYAARSDRGLVRSNNQDSVYAGPRLLALADGMGGHAAGEVASKVVIAALAPLDDDEPGEDLLSDLRESMLSGNSAIAELVASDPDLEGMGTTLTAVLFAGHRLGLVHIGDSRAYLVRDGNLSQITHDDTFVQSLIDEGRITPDEALTHPQRSLLLKALTGHEVEPSLAIREARNGDRYMLCSDGLSGVVSAETLAEALAIPDPRTCADRLIELALKGGGPDNVTVIVADVVDVDFGENAPIVGGAAGDGSADPPPPDSPASRAGALNPGWQQQQPQRPDPTTPPPDPPRGRRWLRSMLLVLLVLVVLGAAGFFTRYWVLQQYYVGLDDDRQVVIFQGVQGSVLGIKLQRKVEGSCPPNVSCDLDPILVSDLSQSGKDLVTNGITGLDGLEGARNAIRRLRTAQVLPPCPSPPPGTPGAGGQPTTTSSAPATTDPNVPSTTDATSLNSPTPKPGVDCRTVR
ncbi:protein phosphatase 2C domain-containing protein [Crossiella sp. SN42]|uniref:PP2C family protein-serine/threonine phosphatase n=1 Tax=Crossiella sp. SN42 TaxID=2944808 RepID=UPI00207C871C|nr:protein phosphatase 2C domain-containing protein [Crossiella sp. SN42]MCO1581387.1 protein phosphatase 2C domain-containing protein [Crossiella sp. SN42]